MVSTQQLQVRAASPIRLRSPCKLRFLWYVTVAVAGRAWICDDLTSPACAYIRVHRRVGTDRLLSKQELEDWARRMVVRAAAP